MAYQGVCLLISPVKTVGPSAFPALQDGNLARKLNTSLAFFVHDAFSLMDRGFVFTLIKTYLKKVSCGSVILKMMIIVLSSFSVYSFREGFELN